MTPENSRAPRARNASVRTAKPRTAGGALGGLLGAIAMSAVAGVLVTAAVTPVIAVSGFTASGAIDLFENLPDHINPGTLAQPSVILARASDGSEVELARVYDQNRQPVGWNEISQYVKDAAVAEEDPRFYSHGGVDVLSAGRAVLQNAASGGTASGASTITMQYVRNVLIQEAEAISDPEESEAAYQEAIKQSIDRKLQEMRYAISIEKKNSKDQILTGYLNIASYGGQVYGIEAAANYYYNTTAANVTLAQAASLVAMVNEPNALRIDQGGTEQGDAKIKANEQRRNKILNSMLRHGRITQAQFDEAIATPIEPVITTRVAGCSVAEQNYGAGHFCDYVLRTLREDPAFGNSPEERSFNIRRSGLRIMTTLNLDMQAAGNAATRAEVPAVMDGIEAGSASSSVEVHTGRVLAMVQNKPYSEDKAFVEANPAYTSINFNTDFDMGGSAGFQVGSTFKAFTLAEWIASGHSVREVVNANGRTIQYSSFRAKCMGGVYSPTGSFPLQNDQGRQWGSQSVMNVMAQSLNGGIASMQQKMDLCDTFDLVDKLGVHRASVQTREDVANFGTTQITRVPSNVYGGIDEIAPLTMASAYAAFAGDGTVCTPIAVDSVTTPDGSQVPISKSKCTQGVSPEVAAGVAYVLENVVTNGLSRHARSAFGIPHLAKTGTTDDTLDNWTVGASTKVATATWMGNWKAYCFSETDCRRVPTQNFGGFGGLMAADQTIWPAIMNVADQIYGGDRFPAPSDSALKVTMQQVPDVSGRDFEEAKKALEEAGFTVADGGEVDSSIAAGLVAHTDPAAGAEVIAGSSITLFRSNGESSKIPGGLVGQKGDDAKSALNAAGFSNVTIKCEVAGGPGGGSPGSKNVVSVNPGEGQEARRNNQVTLTVDCD